MRFIKFIKPQSKLLRKFNNFLSFSFNTPNTKSAMNFSDDFSDNTFLIESSNSDLALSILSHDNNQTFSVSHKLFKMNPQLKFFTNSDNMFLINIPFNFHGINISPGIFFPNYLEVSKIILHPYVHVFNNFSYTPLRLNFNFDLKINPKFSFNCYFHIYDISLYFDIPEKTMFHVGGVLSSQFNNIRFGGFVDWLDKYSHESQKFKMGYKFYTSFLIRNNPFRFKTMLTAILPDPIPSEKKNGTFVYYPKINLFSSIYFGKIKFLQNTNFYFDTESFDTSIKGRYIFAYKMPTKSFYVGSDHHCSLIAGMKGNISENNKINLMFRLSSKLLPIFSYSCSFDFNFSQ